MISGDSLGNDMFPVEESNAWIIHNSPIRPDQTRRVIQSPALGPLVHLVVGASAGATICETVDFGEVQRTLALPVFGGHEAGDDRGGVAGSATAAQSEHDNMECERERQGIQLTLASSTTVRCKGATSTACPQSC